MASARRAWPCKPPPIVLEAFPDGVWFVDLSVLDDPALVPSAIAAVLGVREEGSGLTERLASVLAGKRLLLVLDNFERVVEAAQFGLPICWPRCQGVKVLVTSRTPLHAYGEREYPLAPLPLPDPAHLPSVERLSQYEAVRLFIAAGAGRQTGLRGHERQRPGRRRNLLSAGWSPVGD